MLLLLNLCDYNNKTQLQGTLLGWVFTSVYIRNPSLDISTFSVYLAIITVLYST